MFNRVEAYKKAICDKSIDSNTLILMIDFHYVKGNITDTEYQELLALLE